MTKDWKLAVIRELKKRLSLYICRPSMLLSCCCWLRYCRNDKHAHKLDIVQLLDCCFLLLCVEREEGEGDPRKRQVCFWKQWQWQWPQSKQDPQRNVVDFYAFRVGYVGMRHFPRHFISLRRRYDCLRRGGRTPDVNDQSDRFNDQKRPVWNWASRTTNKDNGYTTPTATSYLVSNSFIHTIIQLLVISMFWSLNTTIKR